MISQLLNEIYFDTSLIPKKNWKKNSVMHPDKVTSEVILKILLGKFSCNRVFRYQNKIIDTDELFIECLNEIGLEVIEEELFREIYWSYESFDQKPCGYYELTRMSFFEKCKVLKIDPYINDRNIQFLLDFCNTLNEKNFRMKIKRP